MLLVMPYLKNCSNTLKYVQGGIDAVNGFYSNSKVSPVQTISHVKSIKRDTAANSGNQGSSQQRNRFYEMEVTVEADNMAPEDCYTVTYNNSRQLQTFYYCPRREYTY
jgi:hypothetical protein